MSTDRRAVRLGVLATVAVVLVSLLGVRMWFLQTVQAEELQARVDRSRTRIVQLAPERGRIFDIDGRILADNARILTVAIDWRSMERRSERTELFRRLEGWVGVPAEDMEDRYTSGYYSPFLPMPVREDIDE